MPRIETVANITPYSVRKARQSEKHNWSHEIQMSQSDSVWGSAISSIPTSISQNPQSNPTIYSSTHFQKYDFYKNKFLKGKGSYKPVSQSFAKPIDMGNDYFQKQSVTDQEDNDPWPHCLEKIHKPNTSVLQKLK